LIGKNKNDYLREDEDILKELIRNYNQWGTTHYIISDDTFNDNELKVDSLLRISKQLPFKLSIMGFIRADLMHARGTTVDKLVEAGFKAMHFGIETFHPEASKLIGKGFTGEKLINYLREVKQKYPKLHFIGSYIIGLPKETLEQARYNINFAIDEGLIDNSPMFALHIPKDTGGMDTSIFSKEWDQYGYEEMSLDEINELLTQPKYSILKDVDYETFGKHNVIWKNEHMNYLDAQIGALQIRADIEPKTGLGGWNCFAAAYTSDNLFCAHGRHVDSSLYRPTWFIYKTDASVFILIFFSKVWRRSVFVCYRSSPSICNH
jgi:hypothetical protein